MKRKSLINQLDSYLYNTLDKPLDLDLRAELESDMFGYLDVELETKISNQIERGCDLLISAKLFNEQKTHTR